MSTWKLGRRHAACVSCEREFEDGESHFSELLVDGESIERSDRCSRCWDELLERESDAGAHDPTGRLWWRARRRVERKAGLAVDLEGLEQVFHLLGSRSETKPLELRYLIALLLLRKRRLFLVRAVVRQGSELLILRRPRRTEELPVQVFEFSPERMEELRGELAKLFEGAGLEEPDLDAQAAEGAETAAEAPSPDARQAAARDDDRGGD